MNVSKVVEQGMGYTQIGTPLYASPEIWNNRPYDVKSDMWSLGCLMYEAITLKPPFAGYDLTDLYKSIQKGFFIYIFLGEYQRIPSIYSDNLNDIIQKLLQIAPNMRPTCSIL